METVDLRSDTVTLPSPAMREAMYRAELGDDVFGEDPTVNRLEALAAERVGKEAGLLVVSGTMGNLTALLTHCQRGHEAIMGNKAHTFLFEAGGSAALGGIHPHTLPNQPDGTLRLEDIEAAIRPENPHHPRTRLICLENTHNRCGGAVLTGAYTDAVGELAHRHGLAVHLDGARLFNAAVALGVEASELTRSVDSVQFCLSKGLSAPVGSMLCGSKAFMAEARRWRKMLGGGMRQVGVLAAAGIEALQNMVDRLAEDHTNARRLAEGLAGIPGFAVDVATVQTNIVIWDLATDRTTPQGVVSDLRQNGVEILPIGGRQFRAVTHYGIAASDIDRAVLVARRVMERWV
ncbi:MAG: low-specificity L-threonine aldolase [Chloroflexota bacterium]